MIPAVCLALHARHVSNALKVWCALLAYHRCRSRARMKSVGPVQHGAAQQSTAFTNEELLNLIPINVTWELNGGVVSAGGLLLFVEPDCIVGDLAGDGTMGLMTTWQCCFTCLSDCCLLHSYLRSAGPASTNLGFHHPIVCVCGCQVHTIFSYA